MRREQLLVPTLLLSLAFVGTATVDNRSEALGQWLEDFGHVGTLKTFKGQVRDAIDTPIPHATLHVTNLRNDKDYHVEADGSGNFVKPD